MKTILNFYHNIIYIKNFLTLRSQPTHIFYIACCGFERAVLKKKLITNNILMAWLVGEHENLFYGENSLR
jgi:hypothetical protein